MEQVARRCGRIDQESLFAEVAAIAAADLAELAPPDRLVEFLQHYFLHDPRALLLSRPPAQVAASLQRHASLAMNRRLGVSHMELVTPELATDGWEADGHSVLAIVTDDKPWLVDTISLVLDQLGWSVRDLIHPQFRVIRDAQGNLLDMAHHWEDKQTNPESWVWVELYPPLGASAAEASPDLLTSLKRSMAELDAAVGDNEAIEQRLLATVNEIAVLDRPDASTAAAMLRWLADDRFVMLGCRDFEISGGADEGVFTPLVGGLGILRSDERAQRGFNANPRDDVLLVVTKDSQRSLVRRSRWLDYIGVHLQIGGRHVERRFLGLFTAQVFTESVHRIPLLHDKAVQVAAAIGYAPDSYGGRAVDAALEGYPRDELFSSRVEDLTPIISRVANLGETRQTVSFIREGTWGRFLSALVYMPRERYNTTVRQRVEALVSEVTGAESTQWNVQIAESPMARLHVVAKMPDGHLLPHVDVGKLRQAISEVSRGWNDRFLELADRLDSSQRGVEFSEPYKEAYTPLQAVDDLVALNQIRGVGDMAQIMYIPTPPENGVDFRLKMMRVGSEMVLSQVMPHLASLGVDVIDERPHDLDLRGVKAHVYDFGLRLPGGVERLEGWSQAARDRFTDAVAASYTRQTMADGFNRLVTETILSWRQVAVLRAIARYLRQLGTTFSISYFAATLTRHRHIAVDLIRYFEAKFDPLADEPGDRRAKCEEIAQRILAWIDEVSTLDEDRILRQYLAVMKAMVRTNHFTSELDERAQQANRGALAFKICPRELDFLNGTQPLSEIFVFAPDVEGVHLRFGKVARGGLRWSDRAEDYRTEVMGLVKAQTVKNSVIVPMGAKGGFLAKNLDGLDPVERTEAGKRAYRRFVTALLSLTDNWTNGQVVGPEDVVAWDEPDPYLVVAADKGTARFSDIANEISCERGFWLGDAFASGGSRGFDHKAMGITARGAWVSVEHHLARLGIDPRVQDFTCVGIGDMSGDVFGNGMLLSGHTLLVAAFNHKHIFLDPYPDPVRSLAERRRLFETPGSNWSDYDPTLISAGGGVYDRRAKSIPVSSEVAEVLGIGNGACTMPPNDLIRAILTAPVDLLWNGGIGTWVKASWQNHSAAGDRANDAVRVDANQIRARVVGEGGNLGWTQAARIEYARAGGLINSDFLDNLAGVATSDREVNIKILLDRIVRRGQLDVDARNELLASVSEEVAELVLDISRTQNQGLADACHDAPAQIAVHRELITRLEADGVLHRGEDDIPSDQELQAMEANGEGLVCPELGMLMALEKNHLAEELLATGLPDDPYLVHRLVSYFPAVLQQRFADELAAHPLAREIISTVAANRFVDSQGIGVANQLMDETGRGLPEVFRAQLAARNLLDAGLLEIRLSRSDLPKAEQVRLRVQVRSMVHQIARWLLRTQPRIDVTAIVDHLKPGLMAAIGELPEVLPAQQGTEYREQLQHLVAAGVDEQVAVKLASAPYTQLVLPIVHIADRLGADRMEVAAVWLELEG